MKTSIVGKFLIVVTYKGERFGRQSQVTYINASGDVWLIAVAIAWVFPVMMMGMLTMKRIRAPFRSDTEFRMN